MITDLPPMLKWGVPIIGGGGIAGITQLLSVATRLKSTLTTGGLANPVVATAESAGAVVVSTMAIVVPVACLLLLVLAGVLILRMTSRRAARRRAD